MKAKLALAVLLLLFPFAAAADKGSMKLLAVSEIEEGFYKGSIADLTLEIKDGDGRVFVNTFPISKLDTQISMRFAKQIACRHIEADCSRHDFIYTLEAETGILGGPSAGAAAAVLTVSLMENLALKEGVAITGTINSGELIGPVGGLMEKIDAAASNGIKKVLVPKGEVLLKEDNRTTNLSKYGGELGVEVAEVATLDEALFYFTGVKTSKQEKELKVNEEYEKIMKKLAVMLCNRSAELQSQYLSSKPENHVNESILDFEKAALNATESADTAFRSGDYYTSASYCFRANIDYRYILNYMKNLSSGQVEEKAEEIKGNIAAFEKETDSREVRTLTDLQAYMITKERIDEAKERRERALEEMNSSDDAAYWLAFSEERLFSAFSWSHFFGAEGQEFVLDSSALEDSCKIKISEAEERYQYVNFYFPLTLSSTRKDIDKAKADRKSGNYIMCLYKASKAKAQANVVLGIIGVEKEMLRDLVLQKINAAEQVIVEQQEAGIFPIMGYSYFEYANSLVDEDVSSAMIYAENALELSNFDFYFEKKEVSAGDILSREGNQIIGALAAGIIIGIIIGMRISRRKQNRRA